MSDRPKPADEEDAEDPATGEPLAEVLEGLDERPRSGFVEGVRRRIHRKALAGQVVELLWSTPGLVFGEWLRMLLSWMQPDQDSRKGGTRDE